MVISKNQLQWIIAIVLLTLTIIVLDYFVEKRHADTALHNKSTVQQVYKK